jgi:hypothetical protein
MLFSFMIRNRSISWTKVKEVISTIIRKATHVCKRHHMEFVGTAAWCLERVWASAIERLSCWRDSVHFFILLRQFRRLALKRKQKRSFSDHGSYDTITARSPPHSLRRWQICRSESTRNIADIPKSLSTRTHAHTHTHNRWLTCSGYHVTVDLDHYVPSFTQLYHVAIEVHHEKCVLTGAQGLLNDTVQKSIPLFHDQCIAKTYNRL